MWADHEMNSDQIIQDIMDAIQNRSSVSLVDHRFILAVILQEVGHHYLRCTVSLSNTLFSHKAARAPAQQPQHPA